MYEEILRLVESVKRGPGTRGLRTEVHARRRHRGAGALRRAKLPQGAYAGTRVGNAQGLGAAGELLGWARSWGAAEDWRQGRG